jgi:hypothetical protein
MSSCSRIAYTIAVSLFTLVAWVADVETGDDHAPAASGRGISGPLVASEPEDRLSQETSVEVLTGTSGPERAEEARDGKSPPQTKSESPKDPVAAYLFGVYQRSPTKRDAHGDFTWKDGAAAERVGMSIPAYVIGGMDPDFREQLYHAGLAMDRAGVSWTILSGFRDDYRQDIAAGLKASTGNSLHGGTVATGGYGHGCAVDLGSVDGLSNQQVWQWVALHGAEFGLLRPLSGRDPAHVQPSSGWHELADGLRRLRAGQNSGEMPANEKATDAPWRLTGEFTNNLEDPCTNRQARLNRAKRGTAGANELTEGGPPAESAHSSKTHKAVQVGSSTILSGPDTDSKLPSVSGRSRTMWFVQLSGGPSGSVALGTYYRVQRKFGRILGAYRPVLARTGGNARWYRARIALNSRATADKLCTTLRLAGGDCIVLSN